MVDDMQLRLCRSCLYKQAQDGDSFGYCTKLGVKVYLGSIMCPDGLTEDDIF